MSKVTDKSNQLNGYLLLFIVFQGLNLIIIVAELLMNAKGYNLMITAGGPMKIYSLLSICLSLFGIMLTSLVVLFFLKRNQMFIKIYIVSTIYEVLIAVIRMIIFSPVFMAEDGFFNATKAMMGIALNMIMLFFWLNFFKSSFAAKVYLKSKPANKRKSRKAAKAKHKFKVIK